MYVSGAILRNPFLQDTDTEKTIQKELMHWLRNSGDRHGGLKQRQCRWCKRGMAMLCKRLNKIDLVLFHIMVFVAISYRHYYIYWTGNGTLTRLCTLPVLGQHWANTLRQYWPNAEPLLPQHWANTTCRYWASTGPIHCACTGPALAQHWGSTTCQHWPDSQPLCSVCIGPMPFIPVW